MTTSPPTIAFGGGICGSSRVSGTTTRHGRGDIGYGDAGVVDLGDPGLNLWGIDWRNLVEGGIVGGV